MYLKRAKSLPKRILGINPKRTGPYTPLFTVDIYNAEASAHVTGLFSTSLFAPRGWQDKNFRKLYFLPLVKQARQLQRGQCNAFWLDWIYRVYVPIDTPESIIDKLVQVNCQVYVMNKKAQGLESTLWRFLPAGESLPFLSIDADENGFIPHAYHVRQWLKDSNDITFIQLPLLFINRFVPISAGSWGGKANAIPNIKHMIEQYAGQYFGCDEAFLSREILRLFRKHKCYRIPQVIDRMSKNLLFMILVAILGLVVYVWFLRMQAKRKH